MKPFNELRRDKKKLIRNTMLREIKLLSKNYKSQYVGYLIAKKWEELTGAEPCFSLQDRGCAVSLYLTPEQNVTKDVMLFVDEINGMCVGITGVEYKTDTDSVSVDFKWHKDRNTNINLYFYYGSGNCQRKLIRTETKIVDKPVYELVCN